MCVKRKEYYHFSFHVLSPPLPRKWNASSVIPDPVSFLCRIMAMGKRVNRREGKNVRLDLFALKKAYDYWWKRVDWSYVESIKREDGMRQGRLV